MRPKFLAPAGVYFLVVSCVPAVGPKANNISSSAANKNEIVFSFNTACPSAKELTMSMSKDGAIQTITLEEDIDEETKKFSQTENLAAPLQATWTMDKNATEVTARIEGKNDYFVPNPPFTYDPATGSITFSPPPGYGTTAKVHYTVDHGIQTKYKADGPEDVEVRGKYNNKDIEVEWSGSKIKLDIDEDEAKIGDKVLIIYKMPEGKRYLTPLPGYVEGSIKLVSGAESCDSSDFTVSNGRLVVDCTKMKDNEPFTVGYSTSIFSFAKISQVYDPENGNWEVLVNDAPFTAFSRKGSDFTFEPAIGAGAIVKIIFRPLGPNPGIQGADNSSCSGAPSSTGQPPPTGQTQGQGQQPQPVTP
ncbi:MAG: hypothetical protein AB7T49_09910 [Oligoflexales bacterium]